jgi:hypothetical protein
MKDGLLQLARNRTSGVHSVKFGFEDDREFIEYTENGSKNRSGSYKDKYGNKIVRQFADSSLRERCCVPY